eukprot:Skav208677  [mRNA]  locus=scaffold775:194430:195026:+ [translate_table: standard]
MDKLCATLAYSRRTARRLQMHTVAEELSKLIREVHQLEQKQHDSVANSSEAHLSEEADPSDMMPSRNRMANKRSKKRASSFAADCGRVETQESVDSESVTADARCPLTGGTFGGEDGGSASVLTPEYEVHNIRKAIQTMMTTVAPQNHVKILSEACDKSLLELGQSSALRLEIRIFRARSHLAFLEEMLVLAPTVAPS